MNIASRLRAARFVKGAKARRAPRTGAVRMREDAFFLDGRVVHGEIRLPPASPALAAGFSIFETIRTDGRGRGFRIAAHAARMGASAAALGLSGAPSADHVAEAAQALAAATGIACGRMRVTLSMAHEGRSVLFFHMSPFTPLDREQRTRGIRGITAPFRRSRYSPVAGHKTANHLEALLVRSGMARDEEGIVLNDAGRVCEGLYSNIFVVAGRELGTPALSEGCLPGITRGAVIGIARELGMSVSEREIAVGDMAGAEGAFVTNALGGITPLCSYDGRTFAGGPRPGILELMDALDSAAGRPG